MLGFRPGTVRIDKSRSQCGAQFQYAIQSDNLQDLIKWGPILLQKMKKLPGLTDVNSDQRNNGLEELLDYDRLTAARMGVTPQSLDQTLYDAFGQAQVSTMYTPLNQYHVVMEVAPQYWQNPESLNDIYVKTTNGGQIPLSAVTRRHAATTAIAVNHSGQFPSVTLSFNLATGTALSDANNAILKMEQDAGMPSTITPISTALINFPSRNCCSIQPIPCSYRVFVTRFRLPHKWNKSMPDPILVLDISG